MASQFVPSQEQKRALQLLSDSINPRFSDIAAEFVEGCSQLGFPDKVSGACMAFYLLSNTIRILATCNKVPLDMINGRDVTRIANEAQHNIAVNVEEWIRSLNRDSSSRN